MSATEFTSQLSGLRTELRSFTRHFTRDPDESLDLVQDTLLKALLYRDKFAAGTNLKGWLFTIMQNTFINSYRRRQRTTADRNEASARLMVNVEDDYTFNRPHETMEFKEIWGNVTTIKEELMTPFKMHTSGYKYQEIASALELPIGTVKNRIFQARKEIQKKLQGYS